MPHKLPKLGYSFDALEPHIDARTMEIHYSKHHATYVTKLNEALKDYPDFQKKSVEDLVRNLDQVPSAIRTAIRNHGGGHLNHSFFWTILKAKADFKGAIADAITARFGGLEGFRKEIMATAMGVFGSGWAWLVVDTTGELALRGTSNQDNPISNGETPLMAIDVWEHAYYLKYQNVRHNYVDAIMNVMNWETINDYYLKTRSTVETR
jgi:Fe-Mn family superoxide dismutase